MRKLLYIIPILCLVSCSYKIVKVPDGVKIGEDFVTYDNITIHRNLDVLTITVTSEKKTNIDFLIPENKIVRYTEIDGDESIIWDVIDNKIIKRENGNVDM